MFGRKNALPKEDREIGYVEYALAEMNNLEAEIPKGVPKYNPTRMMLEDKIHDIQKELLQQGMIPTWGKNGWQLYTYLSGRVVED